MRADDGNRKLNFHMFNAHQPLFSEKDKETAVTIHPGAEQAFQALSVAERELIYLESRNHDGCFKAAVLFGMFISLCPASQQLSVQIMDEEPVLIDTRHYVLDLAIKGPKLHTVSVINANGGWSLHTGSRDEEPHCILTFPLPVPPSPTSWSSSSADPDAAPLCVLDMTRLQYGASARGPHQENYFLGTQKAFMRSMDRVCASVEVVGRIEVEEGPLVCTRDLLSLNAHAQLKRWLVIFPRRFEQAADSPASCRVGSA